MPHSKLALGAMLVTWLAVIGSGVTYLAIYDLQAGASAAAPTHISALAESSPQKLRLLMFVHPRCSCSTASLRELQRVMSRCVDEVDATIYFIRPESASDTWVQGSLWHLAHQVSGVNVQIDAGGKLAAKFAAATSGTIVIYNAAGELRYQGGITAARGHEGDSRGKEAIFALARGEASETITCPVFGCPLRAVNGANSISSGNEP